MSNIICVECTQPAINGRLRCVLHQTCARIVDGNVELCGLACAEGAVFCSLHLCAHYPRCTNYSSEIGSYCYEHFGSETRTCKQWAPHRGKCTGVCYPDRDYCRKHVWLVEAPLCTTCGVKRVPPKCISTGMCHFCYDQSGGPGITSAHVKWMQPHLIAVGLTLGDLTDDALTNVLAFNPHLVYNVTVLRKCVEGDYSFLAPPSMGSFGVSPTWSLPLTDSPTWSSSDMSIQSLSHWMSETCNVATNEQVDNEWIDSNEEVVPTKPTYAEMAARALAN